MLLSVFHRWSRGTALLAWRIRVFFLGAVLGLTGIFLNMSWLVTAALIVLLGAMMLRMLAARDPGAKKKRDAGLEREGDHGSEMEEGRDPEP